MFDTTKQKIILELLLANQDLFARCNSIIKPSYFDASLKKGVSYLQTHFEKYRELPSPIILKAETGLGADIHALSKGEQDYVADEIEVFCRNKAVEEAIYAGPDLLEKGDYETIWQKIREAAQISLNRDLGLSYFENPAARLHDLANNSPYLLSGWTEFDELVGGVAKQEIVLFAAASGVGKSIVMSNLAINLVRQGYRGVYITLELADRVVGKRLDSMVTGINQKEILFNIDEVADKVLAFKQKTGGDLYVKRMPETITTANHIRAYLKEFQQSQGYTPDFVIVDYLDLMMSNRNVSLENVWLADKFKSEELRAVGAEFDLAMITASQLGRCLEINSLVELEDGSKQRIIDIKIGDKIKTESGFNEVLYKTQIKKQKVYLVKTKSGKMIKVSAQHTVPVYNANEEQISELSINNGLSIGHYVKVSS